MKIVILMAAGVRLARYARDGMTEHFLSSRLELRNDPAVKTRYQTAADRYRRAKLNPRSPLAQSAQLDGSGETALAMPHRLFRLDLDRDRAEQPIALL